MSACTTTSYDEIASHVASTTSTAKCGLGAKRLPFNPCLGPRIKDIRNQLQVAGVNANSNGGGGALSAATATSATVTSASNTRNYSDDGGAKDVYSRPPSEDHNGTATHHSNENDFFKTYGSSVADNGKSCSTGSDCVRGDDLSIWSGAKTQPMRNRYVKKLEPPPLFLSSTDGTTINGTSGGNPNPNPSLFLITSPRDSVFHNTTSSTGSTASINSNASDLGQDPAFNYNFTQAPPTNRVTHKSSPPSNSIPIASIPSCISPRSNSSKSLPPSTPLEILSQQVGFNHPTQCINQNDIPATRSRRPSSPLPLSQHSPVSTESKSPFHSPRTSINISTLMSINSPPLPGCAIPPQSYNIAPPPPPPPPPLLRKVPHPELKQHARKVFSEEQQEISATIIHHLLHDMRNISPKSGDPLKTFKCSAYFLLDELMRRLRLLHITPMFEGIRLIGSTAAQIVAGTGRVTVNDLDITIYVDSPYRRFMDILQAEEELIAQLAFDSLGICLNLPEVYDVYFRDSIKVNTSYNNSWSLITVGDDQFTIDIKTVFATVRSYDFSVNSFEIVLDPFFYNDQASTPQVIAESTYGDIDAAQNHLNTRTLVTDQPTLIRRGLFRYCHALAKGFTPRDDLRDSLHNAFVGDFLKEFSTDYEGFTRVVTKYFQRHQSGTEAKVYLQFLRSELEPHVHTSFVVFLDSLLQQALGDGDE